MYNISVKDYDFRYEDIYNNHNYIALSYYSVGLHSCCPEELQYIYTINKN